MNQSLKVAVVTLTINEWYTEIVKYAVKVIENYAKRHNYDFYNPTDVYDKERDCPWYKIKAIQKILHKYDYVFWIDADGFILKPEQDISYFINNHMNGKDLLASPDWNSKINTGIMILKNTPFIHSLLSLVWNNTKNFDKNFHEQASLIQIYEENRLLCQNKISLLPLNQQNVLFIYWANYYPNISFFIHIARCSKDRIGFHYTLDCYANIRMDEDKEGEYEDRIDWLNNEKRCREDIMGWIAHKNQSRMSTRTIEYIKKSGGKIDGQITEEKN